MCAGFTPKEIDSMDLADVQLYMALIPKKKEMEMNLMAAAVAKGFGGGR